MKITPKDLLFTILTLVKTSFAYGQEAPILSDLSQLEWKNRIILINNPKEATKAKLILEEAQAGVSERDIIWFILNNERITTNYPGAVTDDFLKRTRTKYLPNDGFVVLIGKDGGVKARSDAMNLIRLFERIDAMPMRQREMQKR